MIIENYIKHSVKEQKYPHMQAYYYYYYFIFFKVKDIF